MTVYECVRVLKFLSVMGFAGGAIAAFVATEMSTRRRVAHRIASPSLLATWLSGYALLTLGGFRLFELWVVGALLLSLLANSALAYCVARDRRGPRGFVSVAAPIVCIVVLMVLKPTWGQLR